MKLSAYVFLGFLLVNLACKKYRSVHDDVGDFGSGYIRGRILLFDTLTGSYTETPPLAKKMVTLKYTDSVQSANFQYSTMSDSNGYFVFNNLVGNKTYLVSCLDTASSGLIYSASASSISPGNYSLLLLASPADSGNNGFWYRFVDSITQTGLIPGVNVCVFSSLSIYSDTSCLGSTYTVTSDLNGRAYVFNMKPGTYYARINGKFPSLIITRTDELEISDTIVRKTIILP